MAKVKNNFRRNKKNTKITKTTGKKEFKTTGKRGRLIVRNLPFKCSEDDLHNLFKTFGNIKDIKLLRRADKKPVGCGFVEFTSRLDADRAVQKINGSQLLGRPIYVERAVSQDKYEKPTGREKETDKIEDKVDEELDRVEVKEEPSSEAEASGDERPLQKAMGEQEMKISKNARLIIRNLSFKATEEKLREHFSQYGEVVEVKLLRRPDNTLVGCGFVQFVKKTSAAKAICHASGKPFIGRPIIVDWAISKDNYKKMQEESKNKEIKKEDLRDEEVNDTRLENSPVKQESDDGNDIEEEGKQSSSDEEDGSEDEDFDSVEEVLAETKQRKRVEDVDEGKTVFVKNLPFSADDDNFKECMEQFGPVFYALVCKDKLTERSKGSGFVKFKKKEDAEKCLSAGTELKLNETILDPHPALKRTEAEKLKEKTKEKKDNRNLYLVKEGLIIAGTPAAKGVSVSDMEKRLQLERWKTTKLRNLNMFVSNCRLVVHNLPPSLSDKQLHTIFLKHTRPKALIKEARVMRDSLKDVSKGYGFVTFKNHEDALTALREVNNNPNLFTPAKRPIVAFSIENRAALNIKQKRLERSRQKNPLCKDYKSEEVEEVPAKKTTSRLVEEDEHNEPQYVGLVAKPGGVIKMRKKHKLTNQAAQHRQHVLKEKREIKMSRKGRRSEHIKKKKVEKVLKSNKHEKKNNDEAFQSLVNKFKERITQSTKRKWYDE